MTTAPLKFTVAVDSDGEPYPGDYEAVVSTGVYHVHAHIGYANRRDGYTIRFISTDGATVINLGTKEFHGVVPRGEATLAAAKATVRAHAANH